MNERRPNSSCSETYSSIRQNVARRLSEVHGDLSSLSLIISVFSFPLNLEGLGSAKSSLPQQIRAEPGRETFLVYY